MGLAKRESALITGLTLVRQILLEVRAVINSLRANGEQVMEPIQALPAASWPALTDCPSVVMVLRTVEAIQLTEVVLQLDRVAESLLQALGPSPPHPVTIEFFAE